MTWGLEEERPRYRGSLFRFSVLDDEAQELQRTSFNRSLRTGFNFLPLFVSPLPFMSLWMIRDASNFEEGTVSFNEKSK